MLQTVVICPFSWGSSGKQVTCEPVSATFVFQNLDFIMLLCVAGWAISLALALVTTSAYVRHYVLPHHGLRSACGDHHALNFGFLHHTPPLNQLVFQVSIILTLLAPPDYLISSHPLHCPRTFHSYHRLPAPPHTQTQPHPCHLHPAHWQCLPYPDSHQFVSLFCSHLYCSLHWGNVASLVSDVAPSFHSGIVYLLFSLAFSF